MSASRSPRHTAKAYTIGILIESAYTLALLGAVALMAYAIWWWLA